MLLIRKRKDWHFPWCLIFTWLRVTDLEGAAVWGLGQNLGFLELLSLESRSSNQE